MATIEITPTLLLSLLGSLTSLLVATAALSRRARDWDDVVKIKKIVIDGDPENDKLSLLQQHRQLRQDFEEYKTESATEQRELRALKKALNAHGLSDEHAIVDAVRGTIQRQASEASAEARRALINEQQRRFDATQPSRHDLRAEDDPFPHRPIKTPAHLPAYKPIPRDDLLDSDDPADTDHRRRK